MKKYILFAGVNGAGKTTLYQTDRYYREIPRINMDEIVRSFGSWKDSKDVSRAGMMAVRMLKDYFDRGISFNQETTLCGKSVICNINKAHKLGYQVILYYVGVDNVEIAKERVRERVQNGGHGIPEEDIERRYSESLANLKVVLPICDRTILFDNTYSFTKIAAFEKGKCVDKTDIIPSWCAEIVP